jgi:hypothetical protein
VSREIKFTPEHEIGEMVYIKHDPRQELFMVIGYEVRHKGYVYILQCGTEIIHCYPFELSTNKNLLLQ